MWSQTKKPSQPLSSAAAASSATSAGSASSSNGATKMPRFAATALRLDAHRDQRDVVTRPPVLGFDRGEPDRRDDLLGRAPGKPGEDVRQPRLADLLPRRAGL